MLILNFQETFQEVYPDQKNTTHKKQEKIKLFLYEYFKTKSGPVYLRFGDKMLQILYQIIETEYVLEESGVEMF